ncbi:MAG: alpha/beta fold hydrolase [Anaerolineae bacterium]|nr:alpha/beta fold hydrolase [Phycisphaerae bacterium]
MTPIVLQHGLFGFSDIGVGKLKLTYFNKIDRAIAARGHPLIVPRVHPTSSIAKRAAMLKREILAKTPDSQRVVIFAHSMGGLDARYMISRLGMEDRVAALVTICTPHRGSPYADWCIKNLGKRLGGLKLMSLLGLDVRAIADLTTERCMAFNDKYRDAPDVRYLSISAARPWHRVPPVLMPSFKIVHDADGANDGLVSVNSAKWGEHLDTWSADHWHAINKRILPEIHHKTGDVTPKYLRILDRLVECGLCTTTM